MNNERITRLTNVPAYDGEAVNKKYVDGKLNTKADKNDLNGYLKLDGTSQMQGNLEMNNRRITRLLEPHLGDEPATKKLCFDNNESSSQSFFRPTREFKNVGKYTNE